MSRFRILLVTDRETFSHKSDDSKVIIGRSTKADFCVSKENLSREHCKLEIINDELMITDLGSKNGVYVDQRRIAPHTPTVIHPDDQILLSNEYHLKVNTITIISKADIVFNEKSERNARSKSLELLELIPREEKVFPQSRIKKEALQINTKADPLPSAHYERAKMIAAFLLALGSILYHALGV